MIDAMPIRSRRRLLQAVGATALTGLPWSARAGIGQGIEAFAGLPSVRAGQELTLYARDPIAPPEGNVVTLSATRFGWPDQFIGSVEVRVFNPGIPADAAEAGCLSWAPVLRFWVPTDWPSGLYFARFGSGASTGHAPFVVRPPQGTRTADLLVQVPMFTAQAYNPYGGRSLYEYNSGGGIRGRQVSLARPLADRNNASFDPWQPPFIRWLAKNGFAADFCTSWDLHADPGVLDGYRLFATAGHDEYWSRTMRERFDAFVAAGGNAAILSGNTCLYQVRIEAQANGSQQMVCHKSVAEDPGGTPATKTGLWSSLSTPWPEQVSLGIGFQAGASWTNALPRPVTPWVSQRASHWVFANAGLADGSSFEGQWVGYETDAATFRTGLDGRPYRDGLDGTPPEWRTLAQADASTWNAQAQALGLPGERSGYAALGLYCRGGAAGTVFHAGSTDWVYGLRGELEGQAPAITGTITHNVLSRLLQRWSEPVDVLEWLPTGAAGGGYYSFGTEAPAGRVLAGGRFQALPKAIAGSVPVYRLRSPTSGSEGPLYALSTSTSDRAFRGWANEGIAFQAYSRSGAGRVAVYEYRSTDASGARIRRYDTQTPAGGGGWSRGSVAFYAPVG